MPVLRLFFSVLLFLAPFTANAGVAGGDFPGTTVWYAHVDLQQMKSAPSAKELFQWLNGGVFVEIHEEIGIDVGEETDRVTAFADSERGIVVIVEGPVSQETRDKILAMAAAEADMDMKILRSGGKDYYRFGDGGESSVDIDSLEDGGYLSFDVEGKIIVTSTEGQMKELLESNGRVAGMVKHPNALFVLTADKSLVQAGLRTEKLADDDDDWDSNILRNTKQAALLVADSEGLIAIEAQLVSSEPGMAESLGGIINGLISLQAFNSELDPKVMSVLQNTEVNVEEATLSIKTIIDPQVVMAILDH